MAQQENAGQTRRIVCIMLFPATGTQLLSTYLRILATLRSRFLHAKRYSAQISDDLRCTRNSSKRNERVLFDLGTVPSVHKQGRTRPHQLPTYAPVHCRHCLPPQPPSAARLPGAHAQSDWERARETLSMVYIITALILLYSRLLWPMSSGL